MIFKEYYCNNHIFTIILYLVFNVSNIIYIYINGIKLSTKEELASWITQKLRNSLDQRIVTS